MLFTLISNILTYSKAALAGEIVNNRLNPIHLSFAAVAYAIQSQTLHIPDQYGFFSPGPPRLQVYEAAAFFAAVFGTWLVLVSSGFVVLCMILGGMPHWLRGGVGFLLLTVFLAVFFWTSMWYDRRRAPGYDWGEWKVQKE